MRVIKRIKWPGWVLLVLFFGIISGAIHHFTSMKTEAYVEVNKSLTHGASQHIKKPIGAPQEIENEKGGITDQVEGKTEQNQKEVSDGQGEKIPDTVTEFDPSGKYVALTFDDGPHPKGTPAILQTLKEYNVKATFFMMGIQAEKFPDMVKQVADQGHEIGNHTYSHPNARKRTTAEMIEEVNKTNEMIERAAGKKPVLFRPPYGIYTSELLEYTEKNGISTILWSVDSLDWESKNAEAIHQVVKENVTNQSIILLHDIYTTTAEALPQLIQMLQKEGYQFITVSELLAIEKEMHSGPYYGARK
ncbi:polysaccharide deacetylase family protein [Lysinibacillus odysseyi]|uniref:polysaccharide deacetylase family protein n=1 Tax=Lysinibacillus odysseyi TaxID=202611 RepID=UPI00068B701E|nr:polysaccharide deacetylase family protein [Lysinibacillus odysseyi]